MHRSPVKRVSYTVESARVEQRTDLDKLVMEIETNGAISPEEAIRASGQDPPWNNWPSSHQLEGNEIKVRSNSRPSASNSSTRSCCARWMSSTTVRLRTAWKAENIYPSVT